jgi:glycosyltransferase involved in cell wall biosynthesis
MDTHRRLRIAQVAPPFEAVPPAAYGGTERIVCELVRGLHRRGHEVTTFASGDSEVPGRLVPTVPRALRRDGYAGDPAPFLLATQLAVADHRHEFDVVHAHLEFDGLLLARVLGAPVVTTFHHRIDQPWAASLLQRRTRGLVAISRSQASTHPRVHWEAVVHNGLTLDDAPFSPDRGSDLCFVGRMAPEKGVRDAIEIARLTGRRLRIAAKVGPDPTEQSYWESVVRPSFATADVEYLGELVGADRDRLYVESYAALMPGSWPEPFGLVAIEALACGTPVLARPTGGLPEIIRDGIDGFLAAETPELAALVDRVGALDRAAIRTSVLDRFSAERMVDAYLAVYDGLLDPADGGSGGQTPATEPRVMAALTAEAAARVGVGIKVEAELAAATFPVGTDAEVADAAVADAAVADAAVGDPEVASEADPAADAAAADPDRRPRARL